MKLFISSGVIVTNSSLEIKEILPSAMINTVPAWDIPSGVTVAQLGALVEPVAEKQAFLPRYLKRVEAEEKMVGDAHTWRRKLC